MHYVTRSTAAGLSVFKGSGGELELYRAPGLLGYYIALMYTSLRIAVLHVPHFAWVANVPSDFSCAAHERNSLYAIRYFRFFTLLFAQAVYHFAA